MEGSEAGAGRGARVKWSKAGRDSEVIGRVVRKTRTGEDRGGYRGRVRQGAIRHDRVEIGKTRHGTIG